MICSKLSFLLIFSLVEYILILNVFQDSGIFFFFLSFVFFCLFVVVAIFWAAPAAYGGSQARG